MKFMTLNQAAEYLEKPRNTVCKFIREDGLPCARVGKLYLFSEEDIQKWFKEQKQKTMKEFKPVI